MKHRTVVGSALGCAAVVIVGAVTFIYSNNSGDSEKTSSFSASSGANDSSSAVGDNDSVNGENSDNSVNNSSEVVAVKGEFDWDKAMDEFYINGQKVTLPMSINSLGEDFNHSKIVFFEADKFKIPQDYATFIIDGSSWMGTFFVTINDVTPETYTDDTPFSQVTFFLEDDSISIQGLTCTSTPAQLHEVWGHGEESIIDGVCINTYRDKNSDSYIEITRLTDQILGLFIDVYFD